jgi:hypothetical protein
MYSLAALVAAFVVLGAVAGAHVPGCHSARCDRTARRACSSNPACVVRVQHKRWRRTAQPYWSTFEAIARCESTSRWHIATGNGFYGGLQYTLNSWAAVGGHGSPATASKTEQIFRAVLLMRLQGFGAWPLCRRAAGV